MHIRAPATLLIWAAILAIGPASAAASVVTPGAGTIAVGANGITPESATEVTVGLDPGDPGSYLITDTGGVVPRFPCTAASPTSARCPTAGITFLSVDLGLFDDRFSVGPGGVPDPTRISVAGGAGKDRLTGRNGGSNPKNDFFDGGSGNDVLTGLGGKDAIWGGAGADRIYGGNGDDALDGKGGNDLIVGGKGRDQGSGGPGKDRLLGIEKIEGNK